MRTSLQPAIATGLPGIRKGASWNPPDVKLRSTWLEVATATKSPPAHTHSISSCLSRVVPHCCLASLLPYCMQSSELKDNKKYECSEFHRVIYIKGTWMWEEESGDTSRPSLVAIVPCGQYCALFTDVRHCIVVWVVNVYCVVFTGVVKLYVYGGLVFSRIGSHHADLIPYLPS